MTIEHNILSRFSDNKDDVSITILGQAGMAGLPRECWDSLQAQKNVSTPNDALLYLLY